jgi:hypothetical protein
MQADNDGATRARSLRLHCLLACLWCRLARMFARVAFASALLIGPLLSLGVACQTPTQAFIELTLAPGDVCASGSGAGFGEVSIFVETSLEKLNANIAAGAETSTDPCPKMTNQDANGSPKRLALQKGDANRIYVSVRSQYRNAGGGAAGMVEVRRVFDYITHEQVTLSVQLGSVCLGQSCGEGKTCKPVNGAAACVSQVQDTGPIEQPTTLPTTLPLGPPKCTSTGDCPKGEDCVGEMCVKPEPNKCQDGRQPPCVEPSPVLTCSGNSTGAATFCAQPGLGGQNGPMVACTNQLSKFELCCKLEVGLKNSCCLQTFGDEEVPVVTAAPNCDAYGKPCFPGQFCRACDPMFDGKPGEDGSTMRFDPAVGWGECIDK